MILRVRWHRAVHHNQSEVILSDLEAYDCASRPFADRDLAWQIESTAMCALWLFRSPSVESYTEARMRKLEEEFGHDPQFYDMLAWLDTSRELRELGKLHASDRILPIFWPCSFKLIRASTANCAHHY